MIFFFGSNANEMLLTVSVGCSWCLPIFGKSVVKKNRDKGNFYDLTHMLPMQINAKVEEIESLKREKSIFKDHDTRFVLSSPKWLQATIFFIFFCSFFF
jgi:hypothetical protein